MNFTRFCIGLLIVAIIAIATTLAGHVTAGYFLGSFGTMFYMILVMAWVAIFDSRTRWPNTTPWQRFSNIITFKR